MLETGGAGRMSLGWLLSWWPKALVVKAKNALKSESGNLMAVNQPLQMIGKLRQKREVQFIKIA